MEDSNISNPSAPKNFEEALSQLQIILHKLETGQVSLQTSIELYHEAARLHTYCKAQLDDFQARVDIIEQSQGKVTGTTPFERADRKTNNAHEL